MRQSQISVTARSQHTVTFCEMFSDDDMATMPQMVKVRKVRHRLL